MAKVRTSLKTLTSNGFVEVLDTNNVFNPGQEIFGCKPDGAAEISIFKNRMDQAQHIWTADKLQLNQSRQIQSSKTLFGPDIYKIAVSNDGKVIMGFDKWGNIKFGTNYNGQLKDAVVNTITPNVSPAATGTLPNLSGGTTVLSLSIAENSSGGYTALMVFQAHFNEGSPENRTKRDAYKKYLKVANFKASDGIITMQTSPRDWESPSNFSCMAVLSSSVASNTIDRAEAFVYYLVNGTGVNANPYGLQMYGPSGFRDIKIKNSPTDKVRIVSISAAKNPQSNTYNIACIDEDGYLYQNENFDTNASELSVTKVENTFGLQFVSLSSTGVTIVSHKSIVANLLTEPGEGTRYANSLQFGCGPVLIKCTGAAAQAPAILPAPVTPAPAPVQAQTFPIQITNPTPTVQPVAASPAPTPPTPAVTSSSQQVSIYLQTKDEIFAWLKNEKNVLNRFAINERFTTAFKCRGCVYKNQSSGPSTPSVFDFWPQVTRNTIYWFQETRTNPNLGYFCQSCFNSIKNCANVSSGGWRQTPLKAAATPSSTDVTGVFAWLRAYVPDIVIDGSPTVRFCRACLYKKKKANTTGYSGVNQVFDSALQNGAGVSAWKDETRNNIDLGYCCKGCHESISSGAWSEGFDPSIADRIIVVPIQ